MARYRPYRFPTRRPAPVRTDLAPTPPPASLIDAVLRYHDEELDEGAGRTLLRLSEKRLRQRDVRSALGDLAPRAARVSILWNEREGEIIRVLEAA